MDAFNSNSPPPSKDERKTVRRTKSDTDLTHSSTAFTTITSMQGGSRPTTPLLGVIESLKNQSPPFNETSKSSPSQRLAPPNFVEKSQQKPVRASKSPESFDDPELYVISIFKLYQDTWKHVIGVFKENIPALPLGASEEPRTEHVFAWCLHNIRKLNGPKVRAAEDYNIYLYYQLLLVLTSTMADDLSDAVCPPEIGALLSKPILKHWPKQSISIQSHDTIKNELEWKLLEHYVKNSPPSIELIKDMISQKYLPYR